jgi:hypothetical protein
VPEAAVHTPAAMLSEARGLLGRGWCRGAQARDANGEAVPAWDEAATSWSLLGALLAAWHLQQGIEVEEDVVAHSMDARALGDATVALGAVTGSISLDRWNDEPGRTAAEVIAVVDEAIASAERA